MVGGCSLIVGGTGTTGRRDANNRAGISAKAVRYKSCAILPPALPMYAEAASDGRGVEWGNERKYTKKGVESVSLAKGEPDGVEIL